MALANCLVSNYYNVSGAFLRAKQVGEKRGKFKFVVEIAHKAVILTLLFL